MGSPCAEGMRVLGFVWVATLACLFGRSWATGGTHEAVASYHKYREHLKDRIREHIKARDNVSTKFFNEHHRRARERHAEIMGAFVNSWTPSVSETTVLTDANDRESNHGDIGFQRGRSVRENPQIPLVHDERFTYDAIQKRINDAMSTVATHQKRMDRHAELRQANMVMEGKDVGLEHRASVHDDSL